MRLPSARRPSPVSIEYREHVRILVHTNRSVRPKKSTPRSLEKAKKLKKERDKRSNVFQMQSGVALNEEPR